PHFLTCGMSVVPAALSMTLSRNKPHIQSQGQADGAVNAQMEIEAPLTPNQPVNAKLRLTHAGTGQPLEASELAVVHTEKLHLFVVDSSLRDYQHIHPQPTDMPGIFRFDFTPKTSNSYSAWT